MIVLKSNQCTNELTKLCLESFFLLAQYFLFVLNIFSSMEGTEPFETLKIFNAQGVNLVSV